MKTKCNHYDTSYAQMRCIEEMRHGKNKPKHTPTPWKVTQIPSVDLWGKQSTQATVTDSEGNSIAVIGRNSEADAKHIVRAVNSHEELKQKVYEAYHTFLNGGKPEQWWFKEVEALLAKAEGK